MALIRHSTSSTSNSRIIWTHTGHVDGQTIFSLPSIPTGPVEMEINGVDYRSPFITVASNNITWNGSFTLAADDSITFTYV